MKKIISLVLCAAVCLATGCGSKTNTPASSTASTPVSSVTSTPASSAASTPASSVASTPASSAASTPVSSAVSTPAVSVPAVENGKFARGKWNGNVFTSDFFGFKITFDSDWIQETDERLAARNSFADMTDASVNNAVEQSNENVMIYEVFAQKPDTDSLIVVGSLGLGYNRYNGKTMEEYLAANANGLKASPSFKDTRISTVDIAGKKRDCIYTTFVNGTTEVKEIMVVYKNGDYFAIITIGALSADELQNSVKNMLG